MSRVPAFIEFDVLEGLLVRFREIEGNCHVGDLEGIKLELESKLKDVNETILDVVPE
jgi:hypothetical protein